MPNNQHPSQMGRAVIATSLALALLAGCASNNTKDTKGPEAKASDMPGMQDDSDPDAYGTHVEHAASAAPQQVASGNQTMAVTGKADYAKANELGLIPVLEYHRFGPKEERWTRTPDNFRKDLEWLYNNNYVLVNMRDVAERKLDIPAGKKPVVLTFDDSTDGQFRYLKDANGKFKKDAGGKYVIDPNCAIGMMDAFYAKHPEFGRASTFYVLPSGFDQDGVIADKFKYLDETGREIGNHTWAHENMSGMSVAQVNAAVGKLNKFVSQQLGKPYEVKTLALPFGIGPRNDAAFKAVVKGGSGDTAYTHKALLLVGANPNVSPYDKAYKPTAVARIQCIDSEFRNWFNRKPGSTAKAQEPWTPYVSDGDATKVTFPVSLKAKLNAAALAPGQTANPFDPKKAASDQAAAPSSAPVAEAPQASVAPTAAPAAVASTAPEAAASAPQAAASAAPAAPKSTATNVHPGYNAKLPEGTLWDNGKLTHKVKSGDSVEAIAYRALKFTDYYTYPKLAEGIRAANGGNRALKIGETLTIPKARWTPPKPQLVRRDKSFEAKGVYITGTTAGSEMIWKVVKELKAHGGNMVVFDIKDMNGEISYKSDVPLAKEIRAYQGGMITDMPKLIDRLHQEGIHVAVRLTLFHDAKLANKKPQYALKSKRNGRPWKENGYLLWVDPSRQEVQDYNLALAKEVIAYGVDEIQYDYTRFPAQGDTPDIKWSTMATQKAKSDVITAWMKRAYAELHPLGALLSADVYGVVAWDQGIDVRITGQKMEELGPHLDAISPMLYPSHFYGTFDKKSYPPDHPAYFVGEGVKRTAKKMAGSGITIRPWIQAFPYRIRNYGPSYVTAQLKASNDAGGKGWLLWNAENDYRVGFAGVAQLNKVSQVAATKTP